MSFKNIKNARKRVFLLLTITIILMLPIAFLDEEYIYHPTIKEVKENVDKATDEKEEKYSILIDLDRRELDLFLGGKLIKTYPVSGGKPSTPSPIGTWTIIGKAKWGEGFGGGWMAFNVPWGKYGIHGTVYPWLIGENASKGCIRMNNKDVRELYRIVSVGTKVTIVHKNPVRRDLEQGDIGSDVLDIQKKLNELGYYQGGLDGKFGFQLHAAIKRYQKDNGIRVTGKLGPKTYSALFGVSQEDKKDNKEDKDMNKNGERDKDKPKDEVKDKDQAKDQVKNKDNNVDDKN